MAGLVPLNRRNGGGLARTGAGFEDFYNMIDDFFNDGLMPGRNLSRDSFKLDIVDKGGEYLIEAEMPGVGKEEIELGVEDDNLTISLNRTEESGKDGKNYIHRERRSASVSRRVRLANASLADIKARLADGVLSVVVPKEEKSRSPRRIDID
ncbi:MAG: Hsp20 family protein [Oscillospiraceae bacterium]|nr:Hsp20 family protein [Oscillospiraceae bacterium]